MDDEKTKKIINSTKEDVMPAESYPSIVDGDNVESFMRKVKQYGQLETVKARCAIDDLRKKNKGYIIDTEGFNEITSELYNGASDFIDGLLNPKE